MSSAVRLFSYLSLRASLLACRVCDLAFAKGRWLAVFTFIYVLVGYIYFFLDIPASDVFRSTALFLVFLLVLTLFGCIRHKVFSNVADQLEELVELKRAEKEVRCDG